jgi:Ino eighty subunit 2
MPRLRSRANLTAPSAPPTATTTRPRRGTASQAHPAAVIERSSPEDTRQSIHLTVKAPPNKLRKATNGSVVKTAVSSRNIVTGKRARNSRVIRDVSDDEDEDEEPEPKDLDDDAEEEEDDDAEGEEDDDVDAEGEEDDEMDDVTPAPRIIVSNNESLRKSGNNASKPQDKVEAAEMALGDDDDDDELSELDSEEEAEDEDAEGEDEDAEGEEDDELAAQNDEDENEDMDSDDEDRDQTPDLSKLTRRQRAMHVEDSDGGLMALSNGIKLSIFILASEG